MVHKPERWAVNQAGVAPEWQWAWRDLKWVFPFWENPSGGTSVISPNGALTVASTATWTTQIGPWGTMFDGTNQSGSDALCVGPLPENYAFSGTQDMTILLVFNRNDQGGFTPLLGQRSGGATAGYMEAYLNGSDQLVFQVVNSGTAGLGTPTITFQNGVDYVVTLYRKDGATTYGAWVNGVLDNENTGLSAKSIDSTLSLSVFSISDVAWLNADTGRAYFAAAWDRALTADEQKMLARDPFGPVRPRRLTPADVTPGIVPANGYVQIFNDPNGGYVTTPHVAAYNVPTNGILDVRVDAALDSYTGTTVEWLVGKWTNTAAQDSWAFGWNQNVENMRLTYRNDATTQTTHSGSSLTGVFSPGQRVQLRLRFDTAGGTDSVAFYYRTDGDITSDTGWTAAGTQSPSADTIQDTTTNVELIEQGGSQVPTKYYAALAKIDGITVFFPNFVNTVSPHTDIAGRDWTLQGRAVHRVDFVQSGSPFRTKVFVP